MAQITINGQIYDYPVGMRYWEIVDKHAQDLDADVLLVQFNGRQKELHKSVQGDGELKFLTYRDSLGRQAYQRSVLLLFMRALYKAVPNAKLGGLTVEYSLDNALIMAPKGDLEVNEELAARVRKEMDELRDRDLSIRKYSVDDDTALELFRRYKLFDKEKLFTFRRTSTVQLYSLDNFTDYFYGPMLRRTGLMRVYDVRVYRGCFAIIFPDPKDPSKLRSFNPADRVAASLEEAKKTAKNLGLANIGEFNEQIAEGRTRDTILMQEALMEKRFGDLAEQIVSRQGVKLVMIAGPSSSGKTTSSYRLAIQLKALGMNPHPVATDNYFVDRDKTPLGEDGKPDFECLEAMDIEGLNDDMLALLDGKEIDLPTYNFRLGKREYNGEKLRLGDNDILIMEGIHCLDPALFYRLPGESMFKIYVAPLTQLNIDDHNRIPTSDGRVLRRIVRDARTRGYDARRTIEGWPSVQRGEEKYIFPFQNTADAVLNSSLIYELAVIKPYAEALLFGVPQGCEEYAEARRLLKFLDYFLTVPNDDIPSNSLIREFIGGGCFGQ